MHVKSFDQIRQDFEITNNILKECLAHNSQLQKQAEQATTHIQHWLNQNTDFTYAMLEQLEYDFSRARTAIKTRYFKS